MTVVFPTIAAKCRRGAAALYLIMARRRLKRQDAARKRFENERRLRVHAPGAGEAGDEKPLRPLLSRNDDALRVLFAHGGGSPNQLVNWSTSSKVCSLLPNTNPPKPLHFRNM